MCRTAQRVISAWLRDCMRSSGGRERSAVVVEFRDEVEHKVRHQDGLVDWHRVLARDDREAGVGGGAADCGGVFDGHHVVVADDDERRRLQVLELGQFDEGECRPGR